MKRVVLGCVFLIFCFACLSATRRASTTQSGKLVPAVETTPTNFVGFAAPLWLEPSRSGGYVTNGTVGTLVNLGTVGQAWNFTNGSALPVPPERQVAALNGLDTLYFRDGANNFMLSTTYTSPQPHHVFMAISVTNEGALGFLIGSAGIGAGTSYHRAQYAVTGQRFTQGAGLTADANVAAVITNQWIILSCVWSNASSTLLTNGVKGLTVNMGTSLSSGMTIGADAGISKPRFTLASLIAFTNMVCDANQSSNVIRYLTNRFGVAGTFGLPP